MGGNAIRVIAVEGGPGPISGPAQPILVLAEDEIQSLGGPVKLAANAPLQVVNAEGSRVVRGGNAIPVYPVLEDGSYDAGFAGDPFCVGFDLCDTFTDPNGTLLTAHQANAGGLWTYRGGGNNADIQDNTAQQTPDGVNDYYATLDGVIGAGGQIEMRVRTRTATGSSWTSPAIFFAADLAAGDGIILFVDASSKSTAFVASTVTAWAQNIGETAGTGMAAGVLDQWYKLKVIWNVAGDAIQMYLDDVLIHTGNLSTFGPFPDDGVGIGYPDRSKTQTLGQWEWIQGIAP
jgi:hypothetical protein